MYLRFIRFSICLLSALFVRLPEALSDYLTGASSKTYQVLKYDAPTFSFLCVFASANLRTLYGKWFGPNGNLYEATYNNWQTILRYNSTISAFVNMIASGSGLERPPHGLIYMLPPYSS